MPQVSMHNKRDLDAFDIIHKSNSSLPITPIRKVKFEPQSLFDRSNFTLADVDYLCSDQFYELAMIQPRKLEDLFSKSITRNFQEEIFDDQDLIAQDIIFDILSVYISVFQPKKLLLIDIELFTQKLVNIKNQVQVEDLVKQNLSSLLRMLEIPAVSIGLAAQLKFIVAQKLCGLEVAHFIRIANYLLQLSETIKPNIVGFLLSTPFFTELCRCIATRQQTILQLLDSPQNQPILLRLGRFLGNEVAIILISQVTSGRMSVEQRLFVLLCLALNQIALGQIIDNSKVAALIIEGIEQNQLFASVVVACVASERPDFIMKIFRDIGCELLNQNNENLTKEPKSVLVQRRLALDLASFIALMQKSHFLDSQQTEYLSQIYFDIRESMKVQ